MPAALEAGLPAVALAEVGRSCVPLLVPRELLHDCGSLTHCSSQNCRILRSISRKIFRVPSSLSSYAPVSFEGSGNGQCKRVVTPGKIGQLFASVSLQTVMTN